MKENHKLLLAATLLYSLGWIMLIFNGMNVLESLGYGLCFAGVFVASASLSLQMFASHIEETKESYGGFDEFNLIPDDDKQEREGKLCPCGHIHEPSYSGEGLRTYCVEGSQCNSDECDWSIIQSWRGEK